MRFTPTNEAERQLLRRVKATAALQGQTITTYVVELLEQAVPEERAAS